MKLGKFFLEKWFFFIILVLTMVVADFILFSLSFPTPAILLITAVFLVGGFLDLLCECIPKARYYKILNRQLEELDKKYYIAEVIEPPQSVEGKLWAEVLSVAGKSMNDTIAGFEKSNEEYREYVELWVHEVKTPISGAKLICENQGYKNVMAELVKIENYVEQALFYARSGSVEKDYIIKKIELRPMIGELLKKNATSLIGNGVRPDLNVEGTVHTDSKWLIFILQQLLDNAVKYGGKTIGFSFEENVLSISDDGIGIPKQDLPRIFDRGFTGENGRTTAKSTGMGLYLCKSLCEKLGLELTADSDQGIPKTKMSIRFPENPFITFESNHDI
jgi:signal transduction histidine kinase